MPEAPFMEPFEHACQAINQGDAGRLEQLLRESPEILERADESGKTLLFWALDWPGGKPRAKQSLSLLLNNGGDPNKRFRNDGETLLHWAASLDHDAESIPVLVKAGADLEAGGGVIRGGTALLNAVHFGKTEAMRELVHCGAWSGSLLLAAGTGQLDCLKSWYAGSETLPQAAAAVLPAQKLAGLLSPAESQQLTDDAFGCAVFCEQYHCADWLLDRGVRLDRIPDGADSTLLHQVARRGSLSMARYLVTRGADLNVLGEAHPVPPFHYACAHAKWDVMNYLIDAGSKLNDQAAAYCGRLDRIASLKDGGAELLRETVGTRTILGRPIPGEMRRARRAVARFLLQRNPQLRGKAEGLATEAKDQEFREFLAQEFPTS